jgi:magnesium transporter
MKFRKQRPPAGSPPGTLAISESAPPPRLDAIQYSPSGIREMETEDVESLRDLLSEDSVLWLNVQGLGDEKILREIAAVFDIHPLALEDAVNVPQRAKSELYQHQHLIISRVVLLDSEGTVTSPQVCLMIGDGYLLTFQERGLGLFSPVRERIRTGLGPIRKAGPDYLAYALIDTMVDRYYPVAEDLSTQVDSLVDSVSEDPTRDVTSGVHGIRRTLVILRRVGLPQREMVNALLRDRSPFVTDEVRQYLRDTNDHISQIMELVESIREALMGVSDVYQSALSQRTNEIMKVLTILASIFIPLTFIAGIYGMNFDNMPELHHPLGYFGALLAMIVIAGGMLIYFGRRGWLGSSKSRKPEEGD